jgi:hypothetical protein
MDTSGNPEQDTPVPRKTLPTSQSVSPTEVRRHVMPSDPASVQNTAQRARNSTDKGLKRGSVYTGRRPSSPVEDADAKIVRESLLLYRRNTQSATLENAQVDAEEETPLFGSDEIMSSARIATEYEERAASLPVSQNKVMTPAQFERYRQQQELTRKQSKASDSESSDAGSDYEEDEDEAEKEQEAARQRRKQEAHLSVYRQQMMKVTGEQIPSPLSSSTLSRPTVDRASVSTPNLTARMSTLGVSSGKLSSDGDDDEDVPLGILAAHGFPSKHRPPTRLTTASSIPNLRASASASPGSVYGEGTAPRSNLPAFARNLPRDPYFGAGLVNPPKRESLAMGGGSPAYGGPSSSLPPGGLVGVIATEERARALRRGSPNPQANASSHGMPRAYTMGNMAQMSPAGYWGMPGGMMPPQQLISPGEQAQLQISQQMTEIMQAQMQMMQQMMQMQSIPTGTPGLPNSNFLSVPQPVNANMRPMSMASANLFNLPSGPPQVDQRTLSMLDPSMSRWNASRPPSIFPDSGARPGTPRATQGYAPSMAPSERSNVGLASRYRPVSTVGQEHNNPMARSFTFPSSALKSWNDENQSPSSVTGPPAQASDRKSTSLATVTVRPVSGQGQASVASKSNAGAVSDDDEDEGWAEMMKKRERKKSSWKLKSSAPALGDLLHLVH